MWRALRQRQRDRRQGDRDQTYTKLKQSLGLVFRKTVNKSLKHIAWRSCHTAAFWQQLGKAGSLAILLVGVLIVSAIAAFTGWCLLLGIYALLLGPLWLPEVPAPWDVIQSM